MKLMSTFAMMLMAAASLVGDGFSVQLGPFALELGGTDYFANRRILDDPICFSIENRKKLEVIVEGFEKVSSKEMKTVTKKIIIEPYAFGISKDDKPIVRGNIVEEKLIKEVSIKYGEDKFADTDKDKQEEKPGVFGFFRSKNKENAKNTVDIRGVVSIAPIADSRFDLPKDYDKTFKDDFKDIICQARPSERDSK